MPIVLALAEKVSKLKQLSLTGVSVVTNWQTHRVTPLKKQVHPDWEYSGIQDLTCEVSCHIMTTKLESLLKEMFQSTYGWRTPDQVCSYHIQSVRDPVR
jgi:hypothetical protein